MDARDAQRRSAGRTLVRWALAAALGGFVFGYELAVISGALLFVRREFALNAFQQGALVSVLPLGAMAGGLLAGRVADALGRRRALILIAVAFVAATLVATVAPSYGVLLAARALTGVAVGAVSSTTPLYLSEIAPPDRRGRLVTLNQLMVTLGIVTAYVVGLVFSGSGSWRAMFAMGLVPSTLLLAGMVRAAETPAWLAAHGQADRAREVVLQVVDEAQAPLMVEDLGRIAEQESRRIGVPALLRSAAAPAVLIGVALGAMQQFAGINAVIAYAPSVMERSGLGASSSLLSSVVIGLANVAATVVSIRLVDQRGRRPLLLSSAAGACLSLALLGLTFEVSLGGAGSWLSLVFLMAYITAFAIGLGPIFWVLISEIFPPEARAAGAGVATAVNWFSGFVVGLAFAPVVDAIGQGPTFWIFAAVCALAFAFVIRYVPETKGRSFAEIAADVQARVGGGRHGPAVPHRGGGRA
ncbi:MAG TPA: sugar porter family MFS transporter [Baekduia sp.]|jgi:sugar porter (SP) family MFS transporter|nr:sugar porter family MFS transporter [Baekduia sp.]